MCSEACRLSSVDEMMANGGRDMFDTHTRLTSFLDTQLNDLWDTTIRTVLNGQALYEKVTQHTGLVSFGRALDHYPDLSNLGRSQKKKLCKTVSIIKGVYERWPMVVTNLTHVDMVNVDARKLSIYELAECHKFAFVSKYNDSHNVTTPKKRKRKAEPAYKKEHIQRLLIAIQSTGVLAEFNYDPDQIRLLVTSS